jgi:alpha-amylase
MVKIVYHLENRSGEVINTRFGVEFNFGLQAGHADDRYYHIHGKKLDDFYLNSTGIIEKSTELSLQDEWRKLNIELTSQEECTLWRFPIETISLSEAGFERVYQSSAVVMLWDLQLNKKIEKRTINLELSTFK